MFLALRELRRAKARFSLLISAIGLLVFLILFQQALRDGLITSFIGGIRTQSAPVLVYSVDGQRTLQGSVITPALEAVVTQVDGIGVVGHLGQRTFTVRIDGGAQTDAAYIGYDEPTAGGPEGLSSGRLPEGDGEAVGSAVDFSLGQTVQVVSADAGATTEARVTVVGLVPDAQIQVTPTLFMRWADYEAAVRVTNPDVTAVLPSALGVRPASGTTVAQLVDRINAASDDADALERNDAADESPGVSSVRQSFQIIFLLYGLVVPLVTGLFFLIITFQKSASLTLLRAIGARSSTLVRALLVQVAIVVGGGLVVGTVLYLPLSGAQVGGLTLRFDGGAVVLWSTVLMALGLASALVAARRVLAIDPLEATVGGGAR